MGTFRKILANLAKSRSGNATLLMAVGMPALIGGAGLATDFSQYYLWKRELQHAVDQAAIAGAFALASDREALYDDRALQEFSANMGVTDDFAGDPTVQLADYGGGTGNSVVVRISATRRLPFSSFLTDSPLLVEAAAQATWRKGDSFAACVKALSEEGTGISVDNGAKVNAKCGLAALSCRKHKVTDEIGKGYAIEIAENAEVDVNSITACGDIKAPDGLPVTPGVSGLVDEYKDLPTPQPEDSTERSLECSKGKNKTANPVPGVYSGFVAKCQVTMKPGIYVINGGVLDLSTNYPITGTGVMFILKNGAQLKLGGTGNTGNLVESPISLTPMTSSQFLTTPNEPYADRYAGVLIFEDKNSKIGGENQKHVINGNTKGAIEGLIYTPANTIRINGGAQVSGNCLLISASRVEVGGGAELSTFCPTDESLSGGYVKGGVRLVA